MLRRLFKRRNADLEDAEPARRLAAVRALEQPGDHQGKLEELATHDPDVGVRRAAAAVLNDRTALVALLDDDRLRQAAAVRLADIAPDFDDHPFLLEARLTATDDEETARALLQRIDVDARPALICRCVRPLRQALARELRGEVAIAALEKDSRGRDKALNRYARDVLDRLRQNGQQRAREVARIDEILINLERAPADDARDVNRWRTLHGEGAQHLDELDRLADALPDIGADPTEAVGAAAALRQRFDALVIPEPPREPPFTPLAQELEAFRSEYFAAGADTADVTDGAFRDTFAGLSKRWVELAQSARPDAQQLTLFESTSRLVERVNQALERLAAIEQPSDDTALGDQLRALTRALVRVKWPAEVREPAALTALTARLAALETELNVERSNLADHRQALAATLDDLATSIDEGMFRQASDAHRTARDLIRDLDLDSRDALARRWRTLTDQLDQLRDWRKFATSPKRDALVDEMTRLAETPLPPEQQAAAVKRLRTEWRSLGPLQDRRDHALFDRFNTQAETAFEPCRVFFEARDALRAENLAAREAICDQLDQYLGSTDWDTADMRAAEQIMRTARDEWKRFDEVDRGRARNVQRRFETLQQSLYDRVRAARDTNIAAKTAIVESARALADAAAAGEPPQTEAVKQLQLDWQAVGPTPRREDQRLWKAFREHCDAVFNVRQQAFDTARAETESRLQEAEQVCDELSRVLDDPSQPVSHQALNEFRQRMAGLGPFGGAGRNVEARFDDLTRHYIRAIDAAAAQAVIDKIRQFKAWDSAPLDPLPHKFFAPRAGTDMQADSGVYCDLTIEAELAAGIDGPPGEQERRMALQVERLNQGFRDRGSQRDEPMALIERWCGLPPASDSTDSLRDRFFRAVEALAKGI